MALDRDSLGNFVGVVITALRREIDESAARAERLGEALKHVRAVRASAQSALESSRAQRAARENRLKRANEARAQGNG